VAFPDSAWPRGRKALIVCGLLVRHLVRTGIEPGDESEMRAAQKLRPKRIASTINAERAAVRYPWQGGRKVNMRVKWRRLARRMRVDDARIPAVGSFQRALFLSAGSPLVNEAALWKVRLQRAAPAVYWIALLLVFFLLRATISADGAR
jgi:hypothetical protein